MMPTKYPYARSATRRIDPYQKKVSAPDSPYAFQHCSENTLGTATQAGGAGVAVLASIAGEDEELGRRQPDPGMYGDVEAAHR